MNNQVLITGGAGFIGSHLADELLHHGYRVRVLDNLCPQVHGPDYKRPAYLHPEVELLVGDVRDAHDVRRALRGVHTVLHFAAAVGIGQSMYELTHYTDVNNLGTAVLLQELTSSSVSRLLVASSLSIYGEGLYRTASGKIAVSQERRLDQLHAHEWEVRGSAGEPLTPLPTPETMPPSLASVYALSKFNQERMSLMIGRAYDIPTTALRFFNFYGPRQALSNPYTGVLAIFATRYLNDHPPVIFEDGEQRRDFVSVYDVVRACRLVLETPTAADQVINIGSGQDYSLREIASRLAVALGKTDIQPEITGQYRVGDIRHCFADISLARELLRYQPRVSLAEGLVELAQSLRGQIAVDHVNEARGELAERGLMG